MPSAVDLLKVTDAFEANVYDIFDNDDTDTLTEVSDDDTDTLTEVSDDI